MVEEGHPSNFFLSLNLNLSAAESLPSFAAGVRDVVDEGGGRGRGIRLLMKGVSMRAKRFFFSLL